MSQRPLLRVVRLCLLVTLCVAVGGCVSDGPAAKPSPVEAGSGEAVFTQGVSLLCSSELIQERVFALLPAQPEWPALSDQPGASLSGMTVETARVRLGQIVADLHEPHAKFVPGPPLGATASAPAMTPAALEASKRPKPPALAGNPPIPTRPVAKALAGGVGYLLLPGCASLEADELRAYAAATRTAIRDVEKGAGGPMKGWIVDLRLNGGGNVWPMLIGLRPLTGDGASASSVIRGQVRMRFGCDGDSGWLSGPTDADRKEQLRIDPIEGDRLLPPVPVAVLIHSWTMSSGELVAVALRGRANTRFFGEPTAGLTTSTFTATLDDGSLLTFPTHEFAGARGEPVGERIEPDEVIPSIGWPSGDDAVAKAAVAWLVGPR